MSIFPGPSNPIAYAQFRLQGGWRTLSIITSVFAVIVLILIHFSTANALDGTHSRSEVRDWCYVLLMIQAASLWAFGSFRVEHAVRGDVSSRLIESHRMMPVPPIGSVVGYLFGAPFQAFAVGFVTILIGLPCCLYAGIPTDGWLIANGVVLGIAVMLYCVQLLMGLSIRGGFLITLLAGPVLLSVAANANDNIPALGVLFHVVVSRHSVFTSNRFGSSIDDSSVIITVAAYLLLAAILLRASIRKYRSPDDVGLSPVLGLLLVTWWLTLTVLAVLYYQWFSMRFWGYRSPADGIPASMIASLLLSLSPISAAARLAARWDRAGGPTPAMPVRPMSVTAVTALTAVVTAAIPFIALDGRQQSAGQLILSRWFTDLLMSTAVTALFLTSFAFVFRWVYLASSKALGIAFVWMVIVTLAPVLCDVFFRASTAVNGRNSFPTPMLAGSGIASLTTLWAHERMSYGFGFFVQAVFAAIPATLYFRRRNRLNRPQDLPAFPVVPV